MTTTRSYVLGCLEDAKKNTGATRDDARNEPRVRVGDPPGARVAFEDEKGRVFFETFDDAEGARAVPFSATLVPWSDEARATYERRVSKNAARRLEWTTAPPPLRPRRKKSARHARGAPPTHPRASPPTSPSSASSALPSRAPQTARGRLTAKKSCQSSRRGRRRKTRRARSGSLFGNPFRSRRDETARRDGHRGRRFRGVGARRPTLAALAPEIQLETSFAKTGRFFRPEAFSKNERSFVREGAFGEAREPSDAVGGLPKTTRPSRPGVVRHIARIVGAVEIRDETKNEKTAKRERLRLAVLVAAESAFERRHTLRSILAGTPEALAGDAAKKLVCFQMAAGVAEAHARGLSFRGRLGAGDVLVRGAPASPRASRSTPPRSSPTPTTTP